MPIDDLGGQRYSHHAHCKIFNAAVFAAALSRGIFCSGHAIMLLYPLSQRIPLTHPTLFINPLRILRA